MKHVPVSHPFNVKIDMVLWKPPYRSPYQMVLQLLMTVAEAYLLIQPHLLAGAFLLEELSLITGFAT